MASSVTYTWLGHSTCLFQTDQHRILVDPWVMHNPACPAPWKEIEGWQQLDLILITHGHFDHVQDAVSIAKASGATVFCIFEIANWLMSHGVEKVSAMNKGGSQMFANIRVTMTTAHHSGGLPGPDNTIIYGGDPAGFIVEFNPQLRVYITGDTCVFGDMALIAELYQPHVVCLPIGDHFTMGPKEAAKAVQLIRPKKVLPVHYGTFPLLTGTPEALANAIAHLPAKVLTPKPGETIAL